MPLNSSRLVTIQVTRLRSEVSAARAALEQAREAQAQAVQAQSEMEQARDAAEQALAAAVAEGSGNVRELESRLSEVRPCSFLASCATWSISLIHPSCSPIRLGYYKFSVWVCACWRMHGCHPCSVLHWEHLVLCFLLPSGPGCFGQV